MSLLTRSFFIIVGLVTAIFAVSASSNQPFGADMTIKWTAAYGFLLCLGLCFLATGIEGRPSWVANIFCFAATGCLYVMIYQMDGPLVANMIFGGSLLVAPIFVWLAKRDAERIARSVIR